MRSLNCRLEKNCFFFFNLLLKNSKYKRQFVVLTAFIKNHKTKDCIWIWSWVEEYRVHEEQTKSQPNKLKVQKNNCKEYNRIDHLNCILFIFFDSPMDLNPKIHIAPSLFAINKPIAYDACKEKMVKRGRRNATKNDWNKQQVVIALSHTMCAKTKPTSPRKTFRDRDQENRFFTHVYAYICVFVCIFYKFTKPYNKRLELKTFFFCVFFVCAGWLNSCVFICSFYCVFAISIFWFALFFLHFKRYHFFTVSFTGYNNQNVELRFSVVETQFCRIDLFNLNLLHSWISLRCW